MSIRTDVPRSRQVWTLLLLVLVLVMTASTGRTGPANSKDDEGHWDNVHLIYTTDIKGKIEPCG